MKHYSIRTEDAFISWIRDYIFFNHKRHPSNMGATEVTKYLTWLAIRKNVAASTQNQALNAIVFLNKQVFNQDLGNISGTIRTKKPILVPTDLSCLEVIKIFVSTNGIWRVMLGLLYGSGSRNY